MIDSGSIRADQVTPDGNRPFGSLLGQTLQAFDPVDVRHPDGSRSTFVLRERQKSAEVAI
jgi:hypothetical protein